MARLSIYLCALVVLTSLAACGSSRPQQGSSGPSLTVNVDLTVQLKSHRVTTINLLPSDHPSGVVALTAVHDGHLTTIGSQRFSSLNNPAYLVIEPSAHDVELGWNMPQGAGAAKASCGTTFPAGSTFAGTSYGNETLDPGSSQATDTVWELTLDTGKPTSDGSGVSDASAASVAESKNFPSQTAYCLTITLDRT